VFVVARGSINAMKKSNNQRRDINLCRKITRMAASTQRVCLRDLLMTRIRRDIAIMP